VEELLGLSFLNATESFNFCLIFFYFNNCFFLAIYFIYLAFSAFLKSFIIRITRINFTILTALVAALDAFD
jgi:hypothetical protein